MPILEKIHGFQHGKQKTKPEWGSITISETVLIETNTPSATQLDIVRELPAYPASPSASNPLGLSFTFDLSSHPESNDALLRSAGELKQIDDSGIFWEIELNYSIFSIWEFTGAVGSGGANNNNPRKRKDQRAVRNPLDRPVVWNSSTSIVQKETYTKAGSSNPILHTNGLPLTQPFKYSEVHETHNFSYNIEYTSFNYTTYRGYVGKVSDTNVFGVTGQNVKLSSLSCTEEYETIDIDGTGTRVEYHFVRVTVSFEINPSGWVNDAKVVSMSTIQLQQLIVFPFTVYYTGIKTSATEYAKEPWPLTAIGTAIPYDDNDPADYGYVDHGYPVLADLTDITTIKSLAIP